MWPGTTFLCSTQVATFVFPLVMCPLRLVHKQLNLKVCVGTLAWEEPPVLGSKPEEREMHAAACPNERRMVVYGGRNALGSVLADVHALVR